MNVVATYLARRRWLVAIIAAVVGAVVVAVPSVFAQAVTPVTMNLNEAQAFTNVAQQGDLLVLIRYELPLDEWQTTTPAFMSDVDCVDDEAPRDSCYTSLVSGIALHTMYDNDPDDGGLLLGSRTLPRIGHGLSGLYFAPGHGITPSSLDVQTCIEGSATVFSPVPQTCITLQWNVTTDLAETRTDAPATLIQMALNLDDASDYAFRMIDQNLISDFGVIFFTEAFGVFLKAVPGAFVLGVETVFEDFNSTATPTALETGIQGTAQSSQAYLTVDHAARQYLGMSVRTLGSMMVGVVAMVAVAGSYAWTRSTEIAALFAVPFVGFGVWMDWIPVGAAFALLAVTLVVGAIWVFRRIPR